MAELALACKVAIAVLLVAAGGAKLADLAGFAATVRLFLPARTTPRQRLAVAVVIAVAEVVIGAASLSSPLVGGLNLAVLALCCGFVGVSAVGYRRHPGRTCRCFGALAGRSFNLAGIARAVLAAACAAVAALPVNASLQQVGAFGRLALVGGAALIAWCAYTAAAAIGERRGAQPGLRGSSGPDGPSGFDAQSGPVMQPGWAP